MDARLKQAVEHRDGAAARLPRGRGLAALTGMTALSVDMSLPAMPRLQRVFGVDVAAVQLTLSLFLGGCAAGQLVCGPLSDRVGRRPERGAHRPPQRGSADASAKPA